MSAEGWALVATVVFGVPGVIAAYYGYKSANYGHQSYRASQEQLELAREQAAQVPRVELMEVRFRPLRDDPNMLREVRDAYRDMKKVQRERAEEKRERQEQERARVERERREQEEKERQKKRRGGLMLTRSPRQESLGDGLVVSFGEPSVERSAHEPTTVDFNTPHVKFPGFVHEDAYEGPFPNYFLDLDTRNIGRAAAYDVTGWVWFDADIFEPIEYFAPSGVEVRVETEGKIKVELSVQNDGGRLFPPQNDSYTFRIPVQVHNAVDTSFDFEFTSPKEIPVVAPIIYGSPPAGTKARKSERDGHYGNDGIDVR